MSKKHKALLKKEHPDSRYIVDASVKGEAMSVCYAVLTSVGFIIYKHKEKNKFAIVGKLDWDAIEEATFDKFLVKQAYTFKTSGRKTTQLIISDPDQEEGVYQFIAESIKLEIQPVQRKWYRKIVGFRSKKVWKMITAITIYFGLFSGVVDAFGEEEVSKSASNEQDVQSEMVEEKEDTSDESDLAKEEKSVESDPETTVSDKDKAENMKKQDEADKKNISQSSSADDSNKSESTSSAKKETSTNPSLPTVTVTRVVDGDTIEINLDGKTEDVRLLLIDTPETVHPSEPVQPFGPEASKFVKNKLTGEKVGIKIGSERRDHYGRLLAYVYIDGTTIQELLLKKGLARTAYLYNDLTMLDEFHEAQAYAKGKGIGVWSIPGYAHADHNHGYHYLEEEPEPKPEPEPEPEPEVEEPAPEPDNNLVYDPNGPDRDCGDFSTHAQAQSFFMAAGGPGSDPHRLDGSDGDGLACESLP